MTYILPTHKDAASNLGRFILLVSNAERTRQSQGRITRIELSSAIFEYIEVFCNRSRRHSQLGYVSPTEYELTLTPKTA